MARRWCAMTGLLSREDAEAWVAEQAKKKGSRSPRKPAARRPASASGKRKAVADEDDFKSAKRGKKTPQGKKDAAKAKGSSEKKAKKKAESEEEWDSESDGDEEVLPQKKQRGETKANGSAAADGKKTPASGAPKPKSVRDVAFVDGGMDGSDSDDDVPLLQRVKA